jgi:hypothetical protein
MPPQLGLDHNGMLRVSEAVSDGAPNCPVKPLSGRVSTARHGSMLMNDSWLCSLFAAGVRRPKWAKMQAMTSLPLDSLVLLDFMLCGVGSCAGRPATTVKKLLNSLKLKC